MPEYGEPMSSEGTSVRQEQVDGPVSSTTGVTKGRRLIVAEGKKLSNERIEQFPAILSLEAPLNASFAIVRLQRGVYWDSKLHRDVYVPNFHIGKTAGTLQRS